MRDPSADLAAGGGWGEVVIVAVVVVDVALLAGALMKGKVCVLTCLVWREREF
jgi:hypothetical protein